MMSRPTPGHANTVSTMTAPDSKTPSWRPVRVTTGIIAFFRACLKSTGPAPSPFARAVRM